MPDSPGSGRVYVLIVLLLITCSIADWTDDYHSYWVSTRYHAFQSANGYKPPASGGAVNGASALMAMALSSRSVTRQSSALETVYGTPLGSPSTVADDSSSNRSPSARSLDPLSKAAGDLNGSVRNRLSGTSSETGLSGSSLGSGMAGGYGPGRTSSYAFPQ